jgi:hypothetical protein
LVCICGLWQNQPYLENGEIMDDGVGYFVAMIGFILVCIVLSRSSSFHKETFGRPFVFNMNTWLILFGYMMMLAVLALESGVDSYSNGNFFPDNHFWKLFSFTDTGRSLFFYFGLFIFYIAFKSNIEDSSLGWGIWQSIVQLILVALFSLIIVGLAPFVKQEVDKVVNKL